MSLPVLALKGIHVPVSGLFSGVLGGVLGYEIFSFVGSSRVNSLKRDTILSAKHLPLWSNLRNAVNPDRAYFELADDKHNEPLLFHSGLYLFPQIEPRNPQRDSSPTRSSARHRTSLTLARLTITDMDTTDLHESSNIIISAQSHHHIH